MIRAIGFQGQPLVKVDFWPEWAETAAYSIDKGDLLIVDGQLKVNESADRTYYNLSAKKLFLNGELVEPGEVEERPAPRRSTTSKAPF